MRGKETKTAKKERDKRERGREKGETLEKIRERERERERGKILSNESYGAKESCDRERLNRKR